MGVFLRQVINDFWPVSMKCTMTCQEFCAPCLPAYTYFQNFVIQAACFSDPEAFAVPEGGELLTSHCTKPRKDQVLPMYFVASGRLQMEAGPEPYLNCRRHVVGGRAAASSHETLMIR
jgi:hypothetical protein